MEPQLIGQACMDRAFACISPVDGSVYAERRFLSGDAIEAGLSAAAHAAKIWRQTPLAQRMAACRAFVDQVLAGADDAVIELAWQMGRPIGVGPSEFRGFAERAHRMIELAPESLKDTVIETPPPGQRYIRHDPLGVFVTIAPWNYPYLTAVNTILPALVAGNAVILKHSHQTPLCAERLSAAAARVDSLPPGLFCHMHLTRTDTVALLRDVRVGGVNFTGSVAGGTDVERAIAGRFIASGLELGGKDPAYVRADADLEKAVEGLVDGAFFNTGQGCCAIERIYVDRAIFDEFIERFCTLTRSYVIGNPLDAATTLGPMVRAEAAEFVRGQITEAIGQGAEALIPRNAFPEFEPSSAYLAPQVLIGVDHSMRVMTEETFGPLACIMPVTGDTEAVRLMNDSEFGLTASIWTRDTDAALALGAQIETGTVYLNRCDYLDPNLAWSGVKQSGRGCSLSALGYAQVTRPKSFNYLRAG